ncbi:MAG: hypothetical protein RLO08_14905 [Parvibaculaceae bacterium]
MTADTHQYTSSPTNGAWLNALRRYLVFVAVANLVWETLQLPLYTIWTDGTPGEIAFAVAHCTAGDLLIALASLAAGLVVAGNQFWPSRRFWEVAAIAVVLGVGYTVFSEWLNLVVRKSWAYSDLMPVVPVIGTGLSPLMQWIVIPMCGFLFARRAVSAAITS